MIGKVFPTASSCERHEVSSSFRCVAAIVELGAKRFALPGEKSELISAAITQVSNTLTRFQAIAEQWTREQRWTLLLTHIFRHWLGGKWFGELPPDAEPLLSG